MNSKQLSRASRVSLDKAVDWWQKSMQTSKHKTYIVLAGYDEDTGQEIRLRREIIAETLQDAELLNNLIDVSARNEAGLVQKITRVRELLPIESITVFVESRNAVSVKAIFKRKFGKTLQIKKFKAHFEFNHRWISTSTSFAWFCRNVLLRVWFEAKRRMGRTLRKRLRLLFR
ncbi:MAG TPA: hypothetical protein VE689_04970 [Candidatus Udaeobacter sp.]|nr:hypothetical protein [Candidatus Udaeobacter sp.]